MSKDFLEKREQGLEYGYFHDQEMKLLAKLHERLDRETHKKALRDNTPIHDEGLIDHLVNLGIHANTINALSMIPLIMVAWGEGGVHEREREAVCAAAAEHGIIKGSEGWMLMEKWLEQRPDRELMDLWKGYIAAIAEKLDPPARRILKEELLAHAYEVAKAAGGLLGFVPISPGEKHVLEEMEESFE